MKTRSEKNISIRKCRSCSSKKLINILSLGEQYLSDFLTSNKKPKKYPLDLVLCNNCYLLQLRHTAPQAELYTERYGYKSGVNKTMQKELREIVEKSLGMLRTSKIKNLAVVDIGANDGTLLGNYKKDVFRVGIEPIKKFAKDCEKHADIVINDFFNLDSYEKRLGNKKAHLITAISCFYDIDDPNKFLSDVKKILHKDGIFVIQQNYLVGMLMNNAFDNICFKPSTIILGDNKPISELNNLSKVISGSGRLVDVKNTMKRKYNADMVKIVPMYLDPIVATPEHPIRIVKKEYLRFDCGQLKPNMTSYSQEWIQAQNVKRGDWVLLPRLKHQENNLTIDLREFNLVGNSHYRRGLLSLTVDEDTAWMMGLYVAEGHTFGLKPGNLGISFTLNIKETKYAERILELFKKLRYKTTIYKRENHNSLSVNIYCTALARAFKQWFGHKALYKQIPDFLMFASEKNKIAFLRGLFAGDGYIKGNKVHFHSASKTLILQAQLFIGSLGGMVGISYIKPYPRVIRGKAIHSNDSWQLRGSSKRLGEIFGYKHIGKEINHVIIDKDYILVPVKGIFSEHYHGEVNNIETEDNTYLVSNAIVHNCHEHLEYYSLLSLENLLTKHDLEIFDVEISEINGGSFRTFIAHKGKWKISNSVVKMRANEGKLNVKNKKIYTDFAKKVKDNKKEIYAFISKLKKDNKKIFVYGASTRGNTLLQYCRLNNRLIEAAVEKNSEKWGKNISSLSIPIISEEEARKQKPDYMLVLPWFFKEEFIKREERYLKNGGHFIFPLPKLNIV